MRMTAVRVRDLQQALRVHGIAWLAVDGRWGPNTQSAYGSFLVAIRNTVGLSMSEAQEAVLASASTPRRSTSVEVPVEVAPLVDEMAAAYSPTGTPGSTAPSPSPGSSPLVPRPSAGFPWAAVLGFTGALVVVGGLGYFLLRDA